METRPDGVSFSALGDEPPDRLAQGVMLTPNSAARPRRVSGWPGGIRPCMTRARSAVHPFVRRQGGLAGGAVALDAPSWPRQSSGAGAASACAACRRRRRRAPSHQRDDPARRGRQGPPARRRRGAGSGRRRPSGRWRVEDGRAPCLGAACSVSRREVVGHQAGAVAAQPVALGGVVRAEPGHHRPEPR